MSNEQPVFTMGSRKGSPSPRFDFVTYQKDGEAAKTKLENLKTRIDGGISIDGLATDHADHADHFDQTKGDLSKTYQSEHGFSFAKEINAIPDGEVRIIQSEKGFHLVQVLSRVHTPLTEEIKASIIQKYYDEFALSPEFRTTVLSGICVLTMIHKDAWTWEENEEHLQTSLRPRWLLRRSGALRLLTS